MTYECEDCGEEFDTLTSKRLHECSDSSDSKLGDTSDCPICGSDFIEIQVGFESEVTKCIDCGHLLEYEYMVPEQEIEEDPDEIAPECSHCGSSSTEFVFYSRNRSVVKCDDCGYTWEEFGT